MKSFGEKKQSVKKGKKEGRGIVLSSRKEGKRHSSKIFLCCEKGGEEDSFNQRQQQGREGEDLSYPKREWGEKGARIREPPNDGERGKGTKVQHINTRNVHA